MGHKTKLPLVFKSTETHSSSSSSTFSSIWPWANCNHPKTLSFRANTNSDIFKTMNTVIINTPGSLYSSIPSETNIEEEGVAKEESVEMVTKVLNSKRFFFEASGKTSSILEEANNKKANTEVALLKESVAIEIDSRDPFVDFKTSMEEMVEAHHRSLKNSWDFLEQLLGCYLKVNHKSNHGYIVGAFVDLLVGIEFASSTKTDSLSLSTSSEYQFRCSTSSLGGSSGGSHSFTSPLSFHSSASSTGPCLASLMESEHVIE